MRQQGYRVTITGFLPVDMKDVQSQLSALTALAGGDPGWLVDHCESVSINHRQTSREIDDAGNPVPRAPRKPRASKTGKKGA